MSSYKTCFITTSISDTINNIDTPAKFKKNDNYDYYLFTNLDKTLFDTDWEVINIKGEYIDGLKNNIYKSRYMKFMGWYYIKNVMKKEYDAIYYCDGILYPHHQVNWDKLTDSFINSDSGIIQSIHADRPFNIYLECDAIVGCRKDTKHNMTLMKDFLYKNKLPENAMMTENTAFGYNPNNTKLTKAFEYFWKLYTTESPTYRDQPLWSYVIWKYNIKPMIFNMKNIQAKMHYILFGHTDSGYNGHNYV